MSWRRIGTLMLVTCAGVVGQDQPVFEDNILPLLRSKCVACHGPAVRTAGLDVHEISLLLHGSENGPVIQKGSAAESLLWKRVRNGSMPPGKDKLTPEQIELLRQWIDAGAPSKSAPAPAAVESVYKSKITGEDRNFWSFRVLSNPPVPQVRSAKLVSNPVDAFLLKRLEEKGLHYSRPATKEVLVRRAYLDLLGLPPSPQEVDSFVNDRNPEAYAKLIDRLLESPHFGERWGRYWLDLAGYVDTVGRDVQATGYKVGTGRWRYRDYVIRSYNQDKPFSRFLLEQIAGDELFDWRKASSYTAEQLDALTATGFLRTAEDPTDNPERDNPLLRYEVIHQTIDILTSSVMGVTVGCARCHDHKFDPIPQRDYYRIMATLTPAYNPETWIPVLKRTLPDVPPERFEEIQLHNKEISARTEPLQRDLRKLLQPFRESVIADKLQALPEKDRAAAKTAAQIDPAKRNNRQKQLFAKLGDPDLSVAALAPSLPPEIKTQAEALDKQIRSLEAQKQTYGELEALFEDGTTPVTFIHRRGDHESKGAVVGPGGLEVLSDGPADLEIRQPHPKTSGRRLALAESLTREGTPAAALVSRVYVNRVWKHLFGQGLVATGENFGSMGARPTHPELLEWIAGEFQRNGWRTKPLIRTLMLSRAYQQGSSPQDYKRTAKGSDPVQADPENELLWRMRLRRLQSEAIRDSMLAVSGKLNRKLGGPPIKTIARADGMVLIDEKSLAHPEDQYRRSLYLAARRRFNLSLMGVFDHPVMSTNATSRRASAVVLQSLMMMNDAEVHDQSIAFARRLQSNSRPVPEQIALGFRFAFGRLPAADEREWAAGLYSRERDRYLQAGKSQADAETEALAGICHVLLNANEFLYIE